MYTIRLHCNFVLELLSSCVQYNLMTGSDFEFCEIIIKKKKIKTKPEAVKFLPNAFFCI